MASKVFVGNLDFNTTRDEVEALFAQVGTVRDVFLPTDRESGRPRGFAFVEFESDEDAAKAIDFSLHVGRRDQYLSSHLLTSRATRCESRKSSSARTQLGKRGDAGWQPWR